MCEDEIDVAKCVTVPNPFIELLTRELPLRLPNDTINYFQKIGDEFGWPAHRIIELYLRNVAYTGYKIPLDLPVLNAEQAKEPVGDSL